MRVVSVVGARPQFVKLGPVAAAFRRAVERGQSVEHVIVHTGQHYDAAMSDVFFSDLAIPDPDYNLGIGSGAHGAQTGAMLAALEPTLEKIAPDWVLVYGDTNSTLAAAVAAVKLHLPLAHLEAGLRSFNRRMPEEHNRVLTDHAADLLLAPTELAAAHLSHEGLAARTRVVGDVMTDVCFLVRDRILADGAAAVGFTAPTPGPYLVATIHRAENTDDPVRLRRVIESLAQLSTPVLLLAHPRLVARAEAAGIELNGGSLIVSGPLPYPQMVAAVLGSVGVVTDSGGLQKEAYLLNRVATTIRTETEWAETLVGGWNVLDPELVGLSELAARPAPALQPGAPYGSGDAAERVLVELERWPHATA